MGIMIRKGIKNKGPKLVGSVWEKSTFKQIKMSMMSRLIYVTGIKKNVLNFVSFIFIPAGTSFCRPVATEYSQPSNVPVNSTMIKGNNLK